MGWFSACGVLAVSDTHDPLFPTHNIHTFYFWAWHDFYRLHVIVKIWGELFCWWTSLKDRMQLIISRKSQVMHFKQVIEEELEGKWRIYTLKNCNICQYNFYIFFSLNLSVYFPEHIILVTVFQVNPLVSFSVCDLSLHPPYLLRSSKTRIMI